MIHLKDPNFRLLNGFFSVLSSDRKLLGDFFQRSRVNWTHEPTSFRFFLEGGSLFDEGNRFLPPKIYFTIFHPFQVGMNECCMEIYLYHCGELPNQTPTHLAP